jgi:hypothetical protein
MFNRNRDNNAPLNITNDYGLRPYPTMNAPQHKPFKFDERLNSLGLNDVSIPEYGISQRYLTPKEFAKPTDLLHNNVNEKPMIENLIEYTLVLDSNDRNYAKYPNPFNYRVYFNPVAGSKDAYIYRTFENVKYIKLETGVLPRKYNFTRTVLDPSANTTNITILLNGGSLRASNETFTLTADLSGNYAIVEDYTAADVRTITFVSYVAYPGVVDKAYEFKYNTAVSSVVSLTQYSLNTESLEDDKFLLMKIDEFPDVNEMATNQEVARCFSILFPDFVNGDFFYTDTHYVDKIFRFSSLGNLNSLTISLQNSLGQALKTVVDNTFVDTHVQTTNKCTLCSRDANGNVVRDFRCCCNYMRHPFYAKFQNTLMFKVGVVETDIDKGIFN